MIGATSIRYIALLSRSGLALRLGCGHGQALCGPSRSLWRERQCDLARSVKDDKAGLGGRNSRVCMRLRHGAIVAHDGFEDARQSKKPVVNLVEWITAMEASPQASTEVG